MTIPTKGLRLEFEAGIGLKFVSEQQPYPESNGPTDMAYINRLIEEDERNNERPIYLPPDKLLAVNQEINARWRAALDAQVSDGAIAAELRAKGFSKTADEVERRTHGDGIALTSAAHPRAPWWRRIGLRFRPPRLSEGSLETIEIEIPKRE